MTCPSCGGELVEGADRCPVCDSGTSAPRVEGALAADPRADTPPARVKGRPEPIREIPALRRQPRERSWRDEVQERVRSRRQKRADSGLPLFDALEEPADEPAPAGEAAPPASPTSAAAPSPRRDPVTIAPAEPAPTQLGDTIDPFPEKRWELAPAADRMAAPAEPEPASVRPPPPGGPGYARRADAGLADLSLVAGEPAEAASPEASEELDTLDEVIAARRRTMPSLEVDGLVEEAGLEPEVELSAPAGDVEPVERPARPFERVQAAAVDLALFSLIAMVVVYFAGRAARVDIAALAASGPWLAAYLGLLAVFYASYFTGTTGQTPGKLVTGLRVVGPTGRPPAYPRAAARAVTGLAGVLAAGLGCVPMAFDPAARALHDRLFRTRVVRG